MIISVVGVLVVMSAIGFAMFYLTQHSRSGHGGGPSPAAGPSLTRSSSAAAPSLTASAATPNPPTSTKPLPDDTFKAYGEVPIPGTKTLHLPVGQLGIFFHAELPGGGFGPLAIPTLTFNLDPPAGVAEPDVTESIGGTTGVDNVAWRRVWIARITQEGDYKITTDGKVGAFIWARLAFGKDQDQ
jgi:hypothetical protein